MRMWVKGNFVAAIPCISTPSLAAFKKRRQFAAVSRRKRRLHESPILQCRSMVATRAQRWMPRRSSTVVRELFRRFFSRTFWGNLKANVDIFVVCIQLFNVSALCCVGVYRVIIIIIIVVVINIIVFIILKSAAIVIAIIVSKMVNSGISFAAATAATVATAVSAAIAAFSADALAVVAACSVTGFKASSILILITLP
jgi:hypothetical protein